jgi:hypothetical protein
VAGEHTRSACAASQLVQGSEKIACWVCISALIVSVTERFVYSTTRYEHTVLQHLEVSCVHRRSAGEGDERSRCDSGRQERAHGVVMMAFCDFTSSRAASSREWKYCHCSLNDNERTKI